MLLASPVSPPVPEVPNETAAYIWTVQCRYPLPRPREHQRLEPVAGTLAALGPHATAGGESGIPLPELADEELLLGERR